MIRPSSVGVNSLIDFIRPLDGRQGATYLSEESAFTIIDANCTQEAVVARISDVPQPVDPRDPKKVEGQRERQTSENKSTESTAQAADSVNISSDARETELLRARLSDEAANTSDVREDRVANVKARIASGEFDANSPEVKQAVAEGILGQMGI